MELAEMRFLEVIARNRMKDHERNEDIREELGIRRREP
jgi:hypothetical protein